MSRGPHRPPRREYVVPIEAIVPMVTRLDQFVEPYRRLFGRLENGGHARMYVAGRLQRLERRTLEPIANEHGVPRRPLQQFVGAGRWEDKPVRDLLCEQIATELGSPDGVLVLDGSGFQKVGTESVGVQRQWCGRLGKTENCQVGEFVAYASRKGHTLVDCQLYLPKEWADDKQRRAAARVPREIKFKKGWELALDLLRARSAALPHRWVLGDDSYGRVRALREALDTDGERYLLEVPCNTLVRLDDDPDRARTVASVADDMPAKAWERVRTRDGEKGPIDVVAFKMRVTTTAKDKSVDGNDRGRSTTRRETLLVVSAPNGDRWYYLSNAKGISVAKMTKAAACRHYIEESLGTAKSDAGLDEYEVRSWVGWHHHMTLSMLAMLFLVRENTRLKKNSGDDRIAGEVGDGAPA